jgi:hypothetical protein
MVFGMWLLCQAVDIAPVESFGIDGATAVVFF